MKYFLVLLISFLSINTFAQTQTEMNLESYNNYLKADKALNNTFSEIIKKYKSDKDFILNLKKAQNAWIKFRDAEIKAIFPAKDEIITYGSAFTMCYNNHLQKITEERVKQLSKWLQKPNEGDICNGSIGNFSN